MQEPLNVGAVVRECCRFFPSDAIMALDGGNTAWSAAHYHVIRSQRSLVHSGNYGHLGTGLPYAIGAKLARPGRLVYCITGDSAFNFNIQELETALRENLPVINLVMVDGAWLVGSGILVGLAVAVVAAQALRGLLLALSWNRHR